MSLKKDMKSSTGKENQVVMQDDGLVRNVECKSASGGSMNRIMYAFYIILLAVSFVVAARAQSTPPTSQNFKSDGGGGGDVYNFYFQKAPGPVNINQGSSGQASTGVTPAPAIETQQSTPASAVGQLQAVAAPAPAAEPPVKHWSVALGWGTAGATTGYGTRGNVTSSGVSLLMGYNFNKYFGLYGGALYAESVKAESRYAQTETAKRENPWDGVLGLHITPVRINTFGYDLFELGFTGGLMTVTKGYNTGSSLGDEKVGEAKRGVLFVGVKAGIWFDPTVGIVAEYRKSLDTNDDDLIQNHYQASVGLGFRF